jgi:hypothetical protein
MAITAKEITRLEAEICGSRFKGGWESIQAGQPDPHRVTGDSQQAGDPITAPARRAQLQ